MPHNGVSPEILAFSIPILAIILGIAIGFWAIYWGYRINQLK